ncbi:hypothetical protein P3L10_031044 [Capsicum annuum]
MIASTLFIFLVLIFPSGKVAASNMALTPKRVEVGQEEKVDKMLLPQKAQIKKQKYQCLAQLGPCSTKYCDEQCCKWGCYNNYNGQHPVPYCQEIPGIAVRLCACYHDC